MIVKIEPKVLRVAAAIIVLALVLRAAWGISVPVVPISDGKAYDILARALAEHGAYSWGANRLTAYWPPGTSAIYAALYLIFGYGFTSIVAVHVILSTGIVGLTMLLCCQVFDKTTAIVAGFLMAIWPSEVAYVTVLASEIPFTFFVLLGCATWFTSQISNPARAVVSGLAFGVAGYFRPIGCLLPIVVWFSSIPDWRKLRGGLPVMLLSLIVVAATIAPWTIRNAKVFGHFVPMSTSDGVNLWMGNNPNSSGLYLPLPMPVQGLSEYDQNRILSEDALLYISEHPLTFVSRSFEKAVLLHLTETIAVTWNTEGIKQRFGENALFPLKLVTQGYWTGVLLFALGGIAVLVRDRGILPSLTNPALLIWMYFTVVYSIFVVADRYHFPSHPFISMLAAVAILASSRLIEQILSVRRSRIRKPAANDQRA